MIIFFRDFIGRTLTLDIDPHNLIILNKIHEKTGIYTKFMKLIFAGKDLPDECEACECNIAKESTIHVIIIRKFEGA